MFTGLVDSTGTILSVTPTSGATRLTVAAPTLAARLQTGDSVSVSGVCLTALAIHPDATPPHFSADLAAETIARTTLSSLRPGSVVNLELPTPAGSPLGGHIVQGHVDGAATLVSLTATYPDQPETTDWRLRLTLPEALTRYVVPQGSITVEGISLTVASIHGRDVEIAIIPHTYAATSLHTLEPGSPLNIEVDVLSKYAEQRALQTPHPTPDATPTPNATPDATPQPSQAQPSPFHLTDAYLLANGF